MIGIFDSGFGGLTVMKAIIQRLPDFDYVYLGDNGRTPYGTRSQQTIQMFSEECLGQLVKAGAKLIVLACNSASANALEYLQEKFPKTPIIGVIESACSLAIEKSRFGRIGVVGTTGTVNSQAYPEKLKSMKKDIQVYQQACPLLVPLIEEGWHDKPETRMILGKYLKPLKSSHIDTLILGCTHYPIIEHDFQRKMGKNVAVINSANAIAATLQKYLEENPKLKLGKNGQRKYLCTDNPEKFQKLGSLFLGQKIDRVGKIDL